jgi:hypothetical protein
VNAGEEYCFHLVLSRRDLRKSELVHLRGLLYRLAAFDTQELPGPQGQLFHTIQQSRHGDRTVGVYQMFAADSCRAHVTNGDRWIGQRISGTIVAIHLTSNSGTGVAALPNSDAK